MLRACICELVYIWVQSSQLTSTHNFSLNNIYKYTIHAHKPKACLLRYAYTLKKYQDLLHNNIVVTYKCKDIQVLNDVGAPLYSAP